HTKATLLSLKSDREGIIELNNISRLKPSIPSKCKPFSYRELKMMIGERMLNRRKLIGQKSPLHQALRKIDYLSLQRIAYAPSVYPPLTGSKTTTSRFRGKTKKDKWGINCQ